MPPKDSIIIERSTNYAFALSNSNTPVSFAAIRNISAQFYRWLSQNFKQACIMIFREGFAHWIPNLA